VSNFLGEDELQALALQQRVTSNTSEQGFVAAGKFRLPYSEKHAVALGWDGEQTERDDTRSQRQSSPIGRPVVDLDESYQSMVQRLALYAQDEWDIDETLSAYAGVRWAMLRTRTEGANFPEVGNRSGVASPVLQVLWKPAAAGGDQFRFALSRTYKAPRTADLSPRRFVAFDNTATTPDLQGNPDLRPELAWGLDLAYEHELAGKAGEVNVNMTARRIEDVILYQLSFENGVWVSRKANQGSARVYGLEVDSRWRLRATWTEAPDAELRAGVSRNWSTVDAIPGPDNRLDSQVPWSANLGIDWRVKNMPLTIGGSLAYKGSVRARTSLTQFTTSNAMSTLDMYALWKITPAVQLRAAVSNALRPHDVTTDTFTDGTGSLRQTTDASSAATNRLGIEIKL
jgi:outer membrane receptor protein involved in Fe transport